MFTYLMLYGSILGAGLFVIGWWIASANKINKLKREVEESR